MWGYSRMEWEVEVQKREREGDGADPGIFFQKTLALLRLRSGSKFVKYLTKNRRMRCFLQNIPGSAPVYRIAGRLPVA